MDIRLAVGGIERVRHRLQPPPLLKLNPGTWQGNELSSGTALGPGMRTERRRRGEQGWAVPETRDPGSVEARARVGRAAVLGSNLQSPFLALKLGLNQPQWGDRVGDPT